MLLERLHWSGKMDKKDTLVNALMRGLYAPVLEYVYITGDRKTVLELIDRILQWKLKSGVMEKLLYLKRVLPMIRFVKRGDGWIMAMAGEGVVAWLKEGSGERAGHS